MLRVERAPDDGAVDAFLRAHPAGLFYHSTAHRRLLVALLDCTDETLVASDGEEVRGVLPLLALDTAEGRVLNSLPYYGSNGDAVAADEAAARALTSEFERLSAAPGTLSATLVENPFGSRLAPPPAHTHADRRISHVTRLDGWADRLEPSAQRNVRKARREGIQVDRDPQELPRLLELHEEGIRAIGGLPKAAAFFELVAERLTAGTDYDLWVARKEGEVIAALLVFGFGETVEYYTPAVDVRFRPAQPLALILETALGDAAERGFRNWNWGGTWLTQTTLRRFKRKWGAEEREYAYFTRLNDERLLDASPEELRERFPGFYVLPFSALRSAEAVRG